MEINLTQDEVRNQHPELYRNLINKLRESNNRDSQTLETLCEFYYSYGLPMQAVRFENFTNMDLPLKGEKMPNNILNRMLESVFGLSLAIRAGRTRRYIILEQKPQFFIDKFAQQHRDSINENEKEEERFAKLTPDEKNKETQETNNDFREINDESSLLDIDFSKDEPIEYNINDILDKIGRVGFDGLTQDEKTFLDNQSKK